MVSPFVRSFLSHLGLVRKCPMSSKVEKVRVLIADDVRHVREQLRTLLELDDRLEVVAEAADGLAALRLIEESQPHVVLMDARMPGMDGLVATRIIKTKRPQLKVVMLTMYPTDRIDALAAGVDAFLLKGSPFKHLVQALIDP